MKTLLIALVLLTSSMAYAETDIPEGITAWVVMMAVQDEYCDFGGKEAYGVWNPVTTEDGVEVHTICISKQSPDIN